MGEKGANPRPIVVTIATEEERRKILNKAKLSEVGIVPDLTWKQRQAEENLWKVAEEKNKNLRTKTIQLHEGSEAGEEEPEADLSKREGRGETQ